MPTGSYHALPLRRNGQSFNTQMGKFHIFVPFAHSYGRAHERPVSYGLLFNHPSHGAVVIEDEGTMHWTADAALQLDYWVTTTSDPRGSNGAVDGHDDGAEPHRVDGGPMLAKDAPRMPTADASPTPPNNHEMDIAAAAPDRVHTVEGSNPDEHQPGDLFAHYADATGHAPVLPRYATKFWQCRLRYRTQDIVTAVARNYSLRNLSLGVLVVDFFNQATDGDFRMNPACYPNVTQMAHDVKSLTGAELQVCVSRRAPGLESVLP